MLNDWLRKIAKDELNCDPVAGTQTFYDIELSGWKLKMNGEQTFFCLDAASREKIFSATKSKIKYLHKKDSDAPPVLFIPKLGIPNIIDEDIRELIKKNGLVLCEGWKGALALCAKNYNSLAINGCYSANSVQTFFNKRKIELTTVTHILPDTDVLWNLNVTKGYIQLGEKLPQAKFLVPKQKSLLTEEGTLNLAKESPDDWITEEMEDILAPLQEINVPAIKAQLEDQKNKLLTPEQKNKSKFVYKLKDQLQKNFYFVPDSSLYYSYNSVDGLWLCTTYEVFFSKLLSGYTDTTITKVMLQRALDYIMSYFALEPEDATQRFLQNKPNLLAFQNCLNCPSVGCTIGGGGTCEGFLRSRKK